jgi:hypothetical protein
MKNEDGMVVVGGLQCSMRLEQLKFDERGARKIYCSFSILCKFLYSFLPKIAYNNFRNISTRQTYVQTLQDITSVQSLTLEIGILEKDFDTECFQSP